jgi:hypothetical protein
LVATGDCQHRIEVQTYWGIEEFVRDTRSNRIVTIKSDIQPCTAADPRRTPGCLMLLDTPDRSRTWGSRH